MKIGVIVKINLAVFLKSERYSIPLARLAKEYTCFISLLRFVFIGVVAYDGT